MSKYSSNTSTYNPIEFNPNSQYSNDNIEKQRKRELQQQYRDQLDQMVANNVVRKNSAKPVEDYSKQYYFGEPERTTPYQSSNDHRRAEYERYQQGQELEKRSSHDQNPNQRYRQHTPTQNIINWQDQGVSQPQEQRAYSRPEEKNTFAQQDDLRDQLLSKMRGGYTQNNNNIYNVYQRAHDEKEKHMKEFERNVVEKAAQERIEKENQRSLTELEKKNKLAWETNMANKKALEEKNAQKKNKHFYDQESDKRRVHDSLAQFEREEFAEKERKRKALEENNRVLEQQRREQATKNNKLFNDEKIVRDREPFERRHQGEYNYQGENEGLASAMEKLNVRGYQQEVNDYQQEYPYSPSKQNDARGDARSDYVKIRDKARYGNNFNIISNENR